MGLLDKGGRHKPKENTYLFRGKKGRGTGR